MAWRLASSWLTLMTRVRSAGVNRWVGDFGGLEEWLRGQDSNLQPSG